MSLYCDYDYYKNEYGGNMDEEEAIKALKKASRHIDTLTFNRASDNPDLTPYQIGVLKEVCCEMADFETSNKDVIDSTLNSYSINGVTVNYAMNGATVKVVSGVAVKSDTYAFLNTTGLTCRSLRGC